MSSKKAELVELISEAEINRRVSELAETIDADYNGKNPILVGVLKGAYVFLADLSRQLTIQHEIEFMTVSSYSEDIDRAGKIDLISSINREIRGKDVLIVEDIVDTGRTLRYIYRSLKDQEPSSLEIVSLLDKRKRREVEIELKYYGFEIPDHFVFGYGLDLGENYRGLPYIAYIK
jgi:hypoxanthine phosphoribosyltransferase